MSETRNIIEWGERVIPRIHTWAHFPHSRLREALLRRYQWGYSIQNGEIFVPHFLQDEWGLVGLEPGEIWIYGTRLPDQGHYKGIELKRILLEEDAEHVIGIQTRWLDPTTQSERQTTSGLIFDIPHWEGLEWGPDRGSILKEGLDEEKIAELNQISHRIDSTHTLKSRILNRRWIRRQLEAARSE